MYFGRHVKYSLFVLDFNETLISSADFRKIFFFLSLGATTPIGGCILQPSSGL